MQQNAARSAFDKAQAYAHKLWIDQRSVYQEGYRKEMGDQTLSDDVVNKARDMFINQVVLQQVKHALAADYIARNGVGTKEMEILKDILGVGWWDISDSTTKQFKFWGTQAFILAASMAAG